MAALLGGLYYDRKGTVRNSLIHAYVWLGLLFAPYACVQVCTFARRRLAIYRPASALTSVAVYFAARSYRCYRARRFLGQIAQRATRCT